MRGPTVANPSLERSSATTAVVTPQAVLLEFRTAGIGSRVLAKLIDLAVQGVLLVVVAILSGSAAGSASFIIGAVGIFLVIFVYPASEAAMNGQTLGKRALAIRVITADGGPIRFRHAAVRSLIGFIELYLLPPGGPMALVSALLTRRSQRIGDLVAETLVIRDKVDPSQPVFFNPPVGAEHVALTLDTTRLSHSQYGVLRQFVLRSWELDPDARHDLAQHLCAKLETVGIAQPAEIDPSVFVSAVVFAHQHRYSDRRPAAGSMPPPNAATVATAPPPQAATRAPLPPPTRR
ncbi:MAG: RDD family protein [Acidimicrobiales bacterium]|nr:RDD family protein [Acidimicrobiales bacterium]